MDDDDVAEALSHSSSARIAQHHAVATTFMNAAAKLVRRRARFRPDSHLITRQGASSAFNENRISPRQHGGMLLLERGISVQYPVARPVADENHSPWLHCASADPVLKRRNKDIGRPLE
jgi:hypothetical protein